MELDDALTADLNVTMDGATVRAMAWAEEACRARIVVTVPALGGADLGNEPVCSLLLSNVTSLEVLLRRDRLGAIDFGPAIPLAGESDLNEFLSSLTLIEPILHRKVLDDDSAADDWPPHRSLAVTFPCEVLRVHSLYWFAECRREEPGGMITYLLECLLLFEGFDAQVAEAPELRLPDIGRRGREWWLEHQQARQPLGSGPAG